MWLWGELKGQLPGSLGWVPHPHQRCHLSWVQHFPPNGINLREHDSTFLTRRGPILQSVPWKGVSYLDPGSGGLDWLRGCQTLSYVTMGRGPCPQPSTSLTRTTPLQDIYYSYPPNFWWPYPAKLQLSRSSGQNLRKTDLYGSRTGAIFPLHARPVQSPPFIWPNLGLFGPDKCCWPHLDNSLKSHPITSNCVHLGVTASFCVPGEFCWMVSDPALALRLNVYHSGEHHLLLPGDSLRTYLTHLEYPERLFQWMSLTGSWQVEASEGRSWGALGLFLTCPLSLGWCKLTLVWHRPFLYTPRTIRGSQKLWINL